MIVAISRASSSLGMSGLSVLEPRARVEERAAPLAAFVSPDVFCPRDSLVARFVFFVLGTMYLGRGICGRAMTCRHGVAAVSLAKH